MHDKSNEDRLFKTARFDRELFRHLASVSCTKRHTGCLKSNCDLENIYWERFSTKPAASVNITSDIVPHNWGDSFTGAQTDTNIGGLFVTFEKNVAVPIQGIVLLDT